VGGGYPDDTLSYIPLGWMLDEAAAAYLVFAPTAVAEIWRIAGGLGPLHDSRRGLAGYYRYQPRKISARLNPPNPTTLLMQDPTQIGPGQRAQLASVNIHQSVFERIATGNDGYAPIVLNGAYTVIPRPGGRAAPPEIAPLQREQTQEPDPHRYESTMGTVARAALRHRAAASLGLVDSRAAQRP
jgi:hypothetical protein